ncbi:uncharacterized protein LOC129957270 [Argiope bruennichi]|uniref:uncharacterized protein LOC129957270 n=1 Tax=Argiope bruennichi TaxID=94029 RepID=UPI002495A35C|nr:uncharacterized protein LOC129957270 [Argiope bruennichi]
MPLGLNPHQYRMGRKNFSPFSGHLVAPKQSEKPFDTFFIVKRISTEKETFHSVSPFLVEKSLTTRIGEVASVRKLRSGDLLVEVSSRQQSNKILKLKSFGQIPVSITPHSSMNSSKGVITCGELFNVTLEEITEKLKNQGVTHVRRIAIRRDGQLLNTKHLILTFHSPKLPDSIKTGYLKLPVRPYILNPLRCFKCQRFGHSKTNCRGTLTCARCAVDGHESTDCKSKEARVNCKGDHTSFSRSCPKWKVEKEIITTKVKKDITYPEARRLVLGQMPKEGRTYASVTKTPLATSSTQTKHVVIVSTDSDSDQLSSPKKENSATKLKKKKVSKSQKALTLKISKKGNQLGALKSRRSLALDLGKAGLATKDLPSLFGNPSTTELLKIHPSDDDDFQMSCEL